MGGVNRALYAPLPPPTDMRDLRAYLQRELAVLASVLPQGLDLVENTAEPNKVFDGMLRLFNNGDTTYTLAIRMGGEWWSVDVSPYTPPGG